MKGYWKGGACSTHGRDEKCMQKNLDPKREVKRPF
jgi:hypothetical protein